MAEAEILSEQKHGDAGGEATESAVDMKDATNIQQQPLQSSPCSSEDEAKTDPEAFVNNGLIKWQNVRDKWCQKPNINDATSSKEKRQATPIDVDGIIDVLFDPRWRGGGAGRIKAAPVPPRFPKNVPLPQMIDVLTDLWEAEGLDV
eukprot:CAMPEP_0116142514 /NCGR_PEP_ID=MMETSP0329-20121206/14950_1 /TAXON_ID=697910 /ORGANISM="Pseudo-nitzschia arenysensis, Strain B593" /LENGTH=146 /DNA_ID=CAMNT_0003637757 /DNA_START=254 /DNA_END=694 /DNA_ORIENTATION=+